MILAIDTATQYAGLALYTEDGLHAEEAWFAGRRHTTELTPRIVRMLKGAEIQISDLTAIAVSIGPGSFTGVRIGLAIAKGLALPYRLPLIGVPTLDIVAYPFQKDGLPVWAIVQAGRGRILATCYDQVDNVWQVLVEPYVTNVEELAPTITKSCLCVGEIDSESASVLEHGSNRRAQIIPPASRLRRAGYLAEIAAERFANHDYQDSKSLAPIYASSP
ncbi:tRNA (adenosine(37)-N6)-threonylcarbamoyltransferase complex dimerization subunit type 1 TsaB [Anaerolineales bacterium HSG6]|nr:tRNA (adenosine(37)-N6)-threonylcarbamoyltransferase complex dimerization subunit type 1 TsaB [Anaerolineales bacterium HSG6]MDM8531973.1 tRNA (adenosine(37)-N6)-threonylcarbamoyltransferase complex dimerization subunit type 1 TsaB [Anaerolineales bacterium HSG25]